MTAHFTRTLSGRCTPDLYDDAVSVAKQQGHGELGLVVRAAVRAYCDRELGRVDGDPFAPAPGARHRQATLSEQAAAMAVLPRSGKQRRVVAELFEQAAGEGLTPDEAAALLAHRWPLNSVVKRVSELKAAGLVVDRTHVADHGGTRPIMRQTRAGAQAVVLRLTAAGARSLEQARERDRT